MNVTGVKEWQPKALEGQRRRSITDVGEELACLTADGREEVRCSGVACYLYYYSKRAGHGWAGRAGQAGQAGRIVHAEATASLMTVPASSEMAWRRGPVLSDSSVGNHPGRRPSCQVASLGGRSGGCRCLRVVGQAPCAAVFGFNIAHGDERHSSAS
jgi:hypothetical protein